MEKSTKQLIIGGVIVLVIAGALVWFFKMRAYSAFYCEEHPEKSICHGAPGLNQ